MPLDPPFTNDREVIIMDRRPMMTHQPSGKNNGNVQRVHDRLSKTLGKGVTLQGVDVNGDGTVTASVTQVDDGPLNEPRFHRHFKHGKRHLVFSGNPRGSDSAIAGFSTGDTLPRPPADDESNPIKGPINDEKRPFHIILSPADFLNFFFGGLELPDFIKKSTDGAENPRWQRQGHAPDGIPPNRDIPRTLKNAMARRIAAHGGLKHAIALAESELEEARQTGAEDEIEAAALKLKQARTKKPAFFTDNDEHFRRYAPIPQPEKRALAIRMGDISGSVSPEMRAMALSCHMAEDAFLQHRYNQGRPLTDAEMSRGQSNIRVLYITHTETPELVTAEKFRTSERTGGTMVAPAWEMVRTIITKGIINPKTGHRVGPFPPESWNIYLTHSGDGDTGYNDDDAKLETVAGKVLPLVQSANYLEVCDPKSPRWRRYNATTDLMRIYRKIAAGSGDKLRVASASTREQALSALKTFYAPKVTLRSAPKPGAAAKPTGMRGP